MTTNELMKLQIPTAKNSVCFMWATFPMIQDALDVMKAWGFRYRTVAFVWHKITRNEKLFWGCGYYTRSNNEVCLLGIRGKIKVKSHSVHQVIESPVLRHSQKPGIIKDKIVELVGDLPRLEMFARQKTEGWDVVGNELETKS